MNPMINPWLRSRLESAVRALVYAAAGILVEHHVLTASESDSFSAQAVAWLVPALMAGLTWTWDHRSDLHKRLKMLTGFGIGRPVTEHEVSKLMAMGLGATDVKTPKTEIPATGLDSATRPTLVP